MTASKLDLLQGTLDLMVLQTLAAMGSLHGYGIARRIEQASGDQVLLNQGTIYASLVDSSSVAGSLRSGAFPATTAKRSSIPSLVQAADSSPTIRHYWERLTGVMNRLFAMSPDAEEVAGKS